MNMKKAIFTVVSTLFALHALKNRKKLQNENTLYYPYTLLQKK
ncbi:spore coat protein B [Bacillus pseudomycoides]|nr:spore coat protein B [Bacillus pseudomycoides]